MNLFVTGGAPATGGPEPALLYVGNGKHHFANGHRGDIATLYGRSRPRRPAGWICAARPGSLQFVGLSAQFLLGMAATLSGSRRRPPGLLTPSAPCGSGCTAR